MQARPRLRRSLTSLALTLGLCLSGGCDGGSTNTPEGGGGAGGDGKTDAPAEKEGGKQYVYADQFTLTATTKVKFELSSSQGQGAAEVSARSLIEAKPAGDNIELHGRVTELIGYQGSGQLDPEFMKKQAEEAGQPVTDIVAELTNAEKWMIIDHKGELDEDATKAMAQNQGKGDDDMDFGLFALPDLPKVDLEVGKKVTLPTKADERQLPFGSVPVELDVSWTLRAVEGDVAELDVTVEGSGATEFEGGGGTALVSLLEESSFTIFFNLTTKLPISLEGYSASEINVDASGQSIKLETSNEVTTTYEVAAGS